MYLVSGQHSITGQKVGEKVVQCVVVAESVPAVYEALTAQNPTFRALGMATLEDYEKAASAIRAALKSEPKAWPLFVGKGLTA